MFVVTAALLEALTTFFAFHIVEEIPEHILIVVDALGLSLLAVSGTQKALAFRLTPIAAVMMGAISGVERIYDPGYPARRSSGHSAGRLSCSSGDYRLDRRGHRSERQGACRHRSPLGCGNIFGLGIVAVWQHWHLPTLKPCTERQGARYSTPVVSSSRAWMRPLRPRRTVDEYGDPRL